MSGKSYQFQPWNPWWPWRPPWQRSVETLFRFVIAKIATDQSIEDVERELVITLLAKAKKWDMRALEMYLDRLYGKPKQAIEQKIEIHENWYDLLQDIKSGKLSKEQAYEAMQKAKSVQ